ncbi:MAG: hypothetical protein HQ581_19775 [Planctomycetes bacterium]|nr:hypothetical protein [Planctomycetota bacterium]
MGSCGTDARFRSIGKQTDFRYPHYHEPTDTADRIDFDRTARVVRGLEQVIIDLVK